MQNEAWQQPTASRQRSRHDCVVVALADGRTISVPLAFLSAAFARDAAPAVELAVGRRRLRHPLS
jgi:hypothetical protein